MGVVLKIIEAESREEGGVSREALRFLRPTVMIVGPTPPPYHGVSMATEELVKSRLSTTFRLIHLNTSDGRDVSYVDKPDLYDGWQFFRQWIQNLILVVQERPVVYYLPICQTYLGFFRDSLFLLPAIMAGSRIVLHLHGGFPFEQLYSQAGRFWQRFMAVILRRVTRFIVLGETFRPIFHVWASSDRISVVPNGVEPGDSDSVLAGTSGKLQSPEGNVRVLFLSTLSSQKGIFVLLRAVPLVLQRTCGVEFTLAGPWWNEEEKREAERWIDEHQLGRNVSFLGPVVGEAKRGFFQSGDVFVFASLLQEGQPLVVLEAMRHGLPVIVSDTGCLRETVVDGETGFMVPQDDPQGLADRIVELVSDLELRRTMGKRSRERFDMNYQTASFIKGIEQVLWDVIAPG